MLVSGCSGIADIRYSCLLLLNKTMIQETVFSYKIKVFILGFSRPIKMWTVSIDIEINLPNIKYINKLSYIFDGCNS